MRWDTPNPQKKQLWIDKIMALFRAEVKPISRGKGHNAVAAAAYRSGEKLEDTNQYNPKRTTHDYSKKSDILHKRIILPIQIAGAGLSVTRQELWSKVEEHEVTQRGQKMKNNARVAREWLLALPHELTDEENIALAEEFATTLANELGVIADCCIHSPKLATNTDLAPKPTGSTADKESVQEDERNIHAHIMFTTRKATINAAGTLQFTDKADCELDGTARKKKGLVKEADYIKQVRSMWADMLNKRLVKRGIKSVSHLSYKDRDLDVLPQVHEGKDPLTMQKKEHNNDISRRNELVFKSRSGTLQRLANQADEQPIRTNRFIERTDKAVDFNKQLTQKFDKRILNSKQRIKYSKRRIERTESRTDSFDEQAERFNQLTARANRLSYQPSRALIDKAVVRYSATMSYEPILQLSSWAGGGTKPNPEPNPRPLFNARQLNILENVEKHLRGFDDDDFCSINLYKSLTKHSNKWILTMLLEPNTDQSHYDEDMNKGYELVAVYNQLPSTLAKEQDRQGSKSASSGVLTLETTEEQVNTSSEPSKAEFKRFTPKF
jgi:hypothetical protein